MEGYQTTAPRYDIAWRRYTPTEVFIIPQRREYRIGWPHADDYATELFTRLVRSHPGRTRRISGILFTNRSLHRGCLELLAAQYAFACQDDVCKHARSGQNKFEELVALPRLLREQMQSLVILIGRSARTIGIREGH